jgi:pimeloyl-ACP methyl ester carboxylesterase
LKERTEERQGDLLSGYRAQLKGIHRWRLQPPADLSVIRQPTLVANGDNDQIVPAKNTVDLDRRRPNSELVIYPDAGHVGIFQHHREFVVTAIEFLDR